MQEEALKGYRLSPQQKRLWRLMRGRWGGSYQMKYEAKCEVRIKGRLESRHLRAAAQEVIARHEILRTSFRRLPGMTIPMQVVEEGGGIWWEEDDLSVRDGRAALVEEYFDAAPPAYDLEQGPFLRLRLIKLGKEDYVVMVRLPAMCGDAVSVRNLVFELVRSYEAAVCGEGIDGEAAQYADLAEWQNELIEAEETRIGREYWRNRNLERGLTQQLAFEGTAEREDAFEPCLHEWEIAPSLTARIESMARSRETSVEDALLGCWQILLWRHTGQSEVEVGVAFDGRDDAEIGDALGLFAKYLPITCHLEEGLEVNELIEQIGKSILTARDWQEYFSWEQIVEPTANGAPAPFFPFCFEAEPAPESFFGGDVSFEIFRRYACIDRFKIKLSCGRRPGGLVVGFHYDSRLFRPVEIRCLLGQFQTLVERVIANPAAKVGELEMVGEAERRRLLIESNGAKAEWGREKLISELFVEQARRTPDAVAVIYEDERLTYGELDKRANRLAHSLRELGVGPEEVVGLCLERSPDLMVSLIGTLKAGGAYLPLDPTHPGGRLAYILEDAQVRVLLTQSRLRSQLALTEEVEAVCVDELWGTMSDTAEQESGVRVFGDNLAYVIYTSGSTGRPKGVMLRHRSLTNYLLWAVSQYPVDEGCGAPVHSSLSFDLTITGLFTPLLAGGYAHLLSAEDEVGALGEALSERPGYSLVKLTPAHLQLLAEQLNDADLDCAARSFVIGGENLGAQTVRWWRGRAPGTRLFNEYGPTESVVGCSVYEVGCMEEVEKGRAAIPIGGPISNTSLYILDGRQNLTPRGVIGELWIGGEGLARGYLNRPDLTAEKFAPHPYCAEPGERLYRSGDLVRHLRDGQIECLGRTDGQVKVRGYRVELGEVEAALNESGMVKQSAVAVKEDERGDKSLVGYVVVEEGVTAAALKKRVRETAPEYMAPEVIIILEEMPMTANGKIDRKRLPAVKETGRRAECEYVAPRTLVEEIVAGIFEEVLKLGRVGIQDNFFEVGGHSLLATRVVSRVRNVFGVEIGVRSIFRNNTVEDLARRIVEALRDGEKDEAPPLVRVPREGQSGAQNGVRMPLSFAQQRLWFLDQLAPNNPFYNMPGAVRLEGGLRLDALERAINEIVRRHEVLRTRIEVEESEPSQVIDEWEYRELEVEDLTGSTSEEREATARKIAREEAVTGFDLSRGPLLRVKVLKLGDEEHVLLFTMHHIVSDGWSVGILIREVGNLYRAYSVGEESPLEDLPIQYADYAIWQRNWLQGEALERQMSYWRGRLAGVEPLELPTDYPRPALAAYRGASLNYEFAEELTQGLRALSRREGVTLFMTLLAAFKTLLRRYSGQDEIVVGSPIANRTRAEIEGLIGFFVNTLALRTEVEGRLSFQELLRRVREVCLGAYAHQDLPFEQLVESLQPERDLSRQPLFQVMLTLQNAPAGELELSGLRLSNLGVPVETSIFDLLLAVEEGADGLVCNINYNSDLFEAATIERLIGHLGIVLEAVVMKPDTSISEIEYLTVRERRQILEEWNETEREYGDTRSVHEMITERARRIGEVIAVKSEQGDLSYGELNRRANQLAHYLKGRGLGREDLVGICAERSAEMVIAILGILKVGAAYVPIDPADPRQRIEGTLEDAQVKLLLTQEELVGRLDMQGQAMVCPIVCMDKDWDQIGAYSSEDVAGGVSGDELAYVIYTSGSTGRPKGAMNTHCGIRNRLLWMQEKYDLNETDRVLQKTTFSFDVSVWEFLWPLMTGAALVMARPGGHKDSEYLLKVIKEQEITTIHFVPSMLGVFLAERIEEATSLRRVICSGEALTKDLEHRLRGRTRAQVSNLYGPTEAAIDVTYWISEGEGDRQVVPIGRPIANTQMYVLDPEHEPVPVGVKGEIYISGLGLARGYAGRPELTGEKFIPNRFGRKGGERLYRTGDVGRYLSDGNIEFIGRTDAQVKIRGYRIELGEVEAALNESGMVKQSAVAVREDERGDKSLVGYVVVEEGVTAAALKKRVRETAPEYMVPVAVIILEEMPMTANGKIDRKRLPAVEETGRRAECEYVAPRTLVEEIVAGIFEEVLKLERVGIQDNFFEVGGHSLLATRVVSRVRNVFGVEFEVRGIFEDATAGTLAQRIEEAMRGGEKDLERRLAYWKKQFDESLPALNLPADYPRPPVSAHRAVTKSFLLPGDLYRPLKALSRREAVTPSMVLLAAFKTLLYRYTATDLGNNPRFRELLKQAREVALGGYILQNLPFEKLVEEIQPESLARVGLDLTVRMTEDVEEIRLGWTYYQDLFVERTIIRMHNNFETLLFDIVDRPNARLTTLKISSGAETRLSPEEQSDREESDVRKLMSIKRKGIKLPTEAV